MPVSLPLTDSQPFANLDAPFSPASPVLVAASASCDWAALSRFDSTDTFAVASSDLRRAEASRSSAEMARADSAPYLVRASL